MTALVEAEATELFCMIDEFGPRTADVPVLGAINLPFDGTVPITDAFHLPDEIANAIPIPIILATGACAALFGFGPGRPTPPTPRSPPWSTPPVKNPHLAAVVSLVAGAYAAYAAAIAITLIDGLVAPSQMVSAWSAFVALGVVLTLGGLASAHRMPLADIP